MAEILVMPKLGLTMEEGALNAWLVNEGEEVTVSQPLCEVETEKLSTEVESPFSGTLLRTIAPASSVPVGAPIAIIGEPGEDIGHLSLHGEEKPADPEVSTQPTAEQSETTAEADVVSSPGQGQFASPVARKMAKSHGIDLDSIDGSGPRGRITRADVERAVEDSSTGRVQPLNDDSIEKPSAMRRAIAANMSASAIIPQFTLERDVDVTRLDSYLHDLFAHEGDSGRPTLADAVANAVAKALPDHPGFLTSWEEEGVRRRTQVNLGVAVALADGLVVPVIEGADTLSLPEITERRRELQKQVTAGTAPSLSAQPAVFTLTNLGSLGVDRFHALVSPGESGILAIGRMRKQGDSRTVTLALSCDHRVVDGADGARLLGAIAATLEADQPSEVFGGEG